MSSQVSQEAENGEPSTDGSRHIPNEEDVLENDGESSEHEEKSETGSTLDDDDDVTAEELKANIKDALDAIESAGDFSHFSRPPQYFVDPYLCIGSDITPVRLPLQEADAAKIVAFSHQAPFGRGSETIVDRSVRNTWELDVDQFTMLNERAFQDMVSGEFLPLVAHHLGLTGQPIAAELYKMLLYEQGARFKPHTDTEKVPGMFGTLAVCLPCKHEGGDLVLSHQGVTRKYLTSKHIPSFLAWYSDVTHEVQEVTAGYRLVLTYNLLHRRSNMRPSASAMDHSPELNRAIQRWIRRLSALDDDTPTELIYLLEHKYTDANMSLNHLKTNDMSRAKALVALTEKHDLVMYLASMEHEVSGEVDDDHYSYRSRGRGWGRYDDDDNDDDDGAGCNALGYHSITETHKSSLKLKRVVDTTGLELVRDLTVEKDCILDDDPFGEDQKPDNEDYTGYTGNAGAEATHWYRNAALKSKKHASAGSYFPGEVIEQVLKALVWLGETSYLEHAVRSVVGELPLGAFRALNTLLENDDFEKLRPCLETAIASCNGASSKLAAIKTLLSGQLTYQCQRGAHRELVVTVASWAHGQVKDAANELMVSTTTATQQDGKTLAEVMVHFYDEHMLNDVAVPRVAANASSTLYAIAFLATWAAEAPSAVPADAVNAIFRTLWQPVVERFQLQVPLQSPSSSQTWSVKQSVDIGSCKLAAKDLAAALSFCLHDEVSCGVLLGKMRPVIENASAEVLRYIMIPCLSLLQGISSGSLPERIGEALRNIYITSFATTY